MPRSRKTAIWSRATPESGQYCGGVTEQPPVIPALARAWMKLKYTLSGVTSENRPRVTVRTSVPVFPALSRTVTVITFDPGVSGTDAVQPVVPVAVPLPPRLFAQLTWVTLRPPEAAAVPPIGSGVEVAVKVGFEVGAGIG